MLRRRESSGQVETFREEEEEEEEEEIHNTVCKGWVRQKDKKGRGSREWRRRRRRVKGERGRLAAHPQV